MKTIAGMTWAEEGYPAFLCVVKTGIKKNEEKFKTPEEIIRITDEIEEPILSKLFERLRSISALTHIYAKSGKKYISYIDEFRKWRYKEHSNIFLHTASVSSFEAGILTIKDMVTEGRLTFCENSKVKAQLQVFSKLSLKNESEFYAVSALTNVIGAFKKTDSFTATPAQNPKAWY